MRTESPQKGQGVSYTNMPALRKRILKRKKEMIAQDKQWAHIDDELFIQAFLRLIDQPGIDSRLRVTQTQPMTLKDVKDLRLQSNHQ